MEMTADIQALVIQAQMDMSQCIEKPVKGNGRGIRKELGDFLPVLRADGPLLHKIPERNIRGWDAENRT